MRRCLTRSRRVLSLMIAIPGIAVTLQAQGDLQARPGDRVRVTLTSGPRRYIGTLLQLTADSVHLSETPTQPAFNFRRTDVRRIDVSVGRRRNARKGLVIGALAGSGIGAIFGLSQREDWLLGSREEQALIFGAYTGALGATIGVVAGALTYADWWVPAARRVAIVPYDDARGGLGVAIRF